MISKFSLAVIKQPEIPKSRHYDPDKVQKYMQKQKASRKKQKEEERRKQKEIEKRKQEQLEELERRRKEERKRQLVAQSKDTVTS